MLCAFGGNRVAAPSILPLHAYLPFTCWITSIGLVDCARSQRASGERKLDEFNRRYERKLVWLPWQRRVLNSQCCVEPWRNIPAATALCWQATVCSPGATRSKCYVNSIRTIDQMGDFIHGHATPPSLEAWPWLQRWIAARAPIFSRTCAAWSPQPTTARDRPLREFRRLAGVRQFEMGRGTLPHGHQLSRSFPSHPHLPDVYSLGSRERRITGIACAHSGTHRPISRRVHEYYNSLRAAGFAQASGYQSIGGGHCGLGVFGFAKDKREARITTEFFVNRST